MALSMADLHLKPTNPIKMGVALNYSVFVYDIQNDTTQACRVAKSAFDNAMQNIEKTDDE